MNKTLKEIVLASITTLAVVAAQGCYQYSKSYPHSYNVIELPTKRLKPSADAAYDPQSVKISKQASSVQELSRAGSNQNTLIPYHVPASDRIE